LKAEDFRGGYAVSLTEASMSSTVVLLSGLSILVGEAALFGISAAPQSGSSGSSSGLAFRLDKNCIVFFGVDIGVDVDVAAAAAVPTFSFTPLFLDAGRACMMHGRASAIARIPAPAVVSS